MDTESDYSDGSDGEEVDLKPQRGQKTSARAPPDEKDIPLIERLKRMEKDQEEEGFSMEASSKKRRRKEKAEASERMSHKNAPALMMSNKPVRRLRVTGDNGVRKFRDPRFSDVSGKLNHEKFSQSFNFLEKYQEDEVQALERALKKTKQAEKVEELKQELTIRKQQMLERRRAQGLTDRLKQLKSEEREKVKAGKKPFFLKASAVKDVALEQKYDELKKQGKLQQFLAKKRKSNSNKDHRFLPGRRSTEE